MIDNITYRARIGLFCQKTRRVIFKKFGREVNISQNYNAGKAAYSGITLILKLVTVLVLLSPVVQNASQCSSSTLVSPVSFECSTAAYLYQQEYTPLHEFYARYKFGNVKNSPRGIKNCHLNIRSLENKMVDIKNIIKETKPHILGVSEAELKKRNGEFDLTKLKVPGYILLLPKSWTKYNYARVVVYVKNTLEFEQGK